MKNIASAILLALFFSAAAFTAYGQETEEHVIDEVVAQVNDSVITLSRVKREIKNIVDTEVQQGKKREDVEREIEGKRGELIANMINEELLIQKAKDLSLDGEIDAAINRRFVDLMKQYDFKTIDELYQEMEKSGADPKEFREIWRKQIARDIVMQREVQSKLYWGASNKEIKDYYEKHKSKFTKPETVTVSEIYLGFAGRQEDAVREKARKIVAELKAGGDFAKIAAENSDPGVVTGGTGQAKLKTSEISEKLATALKGVKVGGITEPIEADRIGIAILKVDASENASSESYFDEAAVRMALMSEKAPAEQKKFMTELRTDAVIRFNESYRPMVAPILFADDRKEKASN